MAKVHQFRRTPAIHSYPRGYGPPRFFSRKPRRTSRDPVVGVLVGALFAAVIGGGWTIAGPGEPASALAASAAGPVVTASQSGVRFGFCHSGGGYNCVVDGDTAWIAGEKVRLADIDAPETHPPRCASEAELGARATERLRVLLNSGAVTLVAIDRDTDRYGRKLRVVAVDGTSVGETLVSEGLARRWEGARRPWCAAA